MTTTVFCSTVFSTLPNNYAGKFQLLSLDDALSKDWYNSLIKPSWTPAPWMFPIAWIPLKILQVAALVRLTRTLNIHDGSIAWSKPVVSYLVYKALGDTWNKVSLLTWT